MKSEIHLKIFCNLGSNAKENCFCNAKNPQCEKGFKGQCELIHKKYNPFKDIEMCQQNETRTYKREHNRIKAGRT